MPTVRRPLFRNRNKSQFVNDFTEILFLLLPNFISTSFSPYIFHLFYLSQTTKQMQYIIPEGKTQERRRHWKSPISSNTRISNVAGRGGTRNDQWNRPRLAWAIVARAEEGHRLVIDRPGRRGEGNNGGRFVRVTRTQSDLLPANGCIAFVILYGSRGCLCVEGEGGIRRPHGHPHTCLSGGKTLLWKSVLLPRPILIQAH